MSYHQQVQGNIDNSGNLTYSLLLTMMHYYFRMHFSDNLFPLTLLS